MRTWSVAELVAWNLTRIRHCRRLTVRQLSERLTAIGAPMLPSGITDVEKGRRGVSVVDLLAFAAALDASPVDFLAAPEGDLIAVTTVIEPSTPMTLRHWLGGDHPLGVSDREAAMARQLEAVPEWMRATSRHPAHEAIDDLATLADRAITRDDDDTLADEMIGRAKIVAAHVDLLADQVERRVRNERGHRQIGFEIEQRPAQAAESPSPDVDPLPD